MERRQALALLVHGGSATVAMIVGIPTLIYALSPAARVAKTPLWRDLGGLDLFPIGELTAAKISTARDSTADEQKQADSESQSATPQSLSPGVYVWRVSRDEVIVFSRSCTDLGCPVTFDRGSECFFCPCHGGIFNKQGERMAGPPDRPLYRYDTRVHQGVLQVDLSSVPPMI
ncbi:MAG: ubiquinol-cytochrome c reductase iron-sulfur subunit [Planctomycetaceae bacterium]